MARSPSKCLKAAGDLLPREDKVALLAHAKELRDSGIENRAAFIRAATEMLEGSRTTLTKMHSDLGLSSPDFVKKDDEPPKKPTLAEKLKAMQPKVEEAQKSAAAKVDEIVQRQRELEGLRAAMRDPQTGKIYTGWSHQAAIDSVPKGETTGAWGRLSAEWDQATDNTGFIDRKGDFISRTEAEKNWGVSTMEDVRDARKGGPRFARKEIDEQTRDENFKRWSDNAPVVSSKEASDYQFKSGQKVVVEAFHGTKRPDRVGTVFKKSRATSGPMSFFTAEPTLASSYAMGKTDTSLANEDQHYATWFKVKFPGERGNPVDIDRTWYRLPEEMKQKIAELAPRVMTDDTGENIILGPEGEKRGNGGYYVDSTRTPYDRRGNPLKALVDAWLDSGSLYDNEHEFLKVLKLAGFPVEHVTYDSPHAEYPFVYHTWVSMKRPLVTGDIPQEVTDALLAAAKRDRSRADAGGSDMWDKNTRTLREWVANFTDPANDSSSYVWTSIPDKVTEVFKSLGYDGIVDWSGKGGGHQHPVYIPFEESQVKSVNGNKGTFDPEKKDIRFSRKDEEERRQSHGFHTREIQVDGKWRPIEDSSGRLLARGDFRGQQNFHRWFKDSVVTDERGRPLTVFHGTDADITQFNTDVHADADKARLGAYFTSDPRVAGHYGDTVMPVYLSIKKPFDIAGMTPLEAIDTMPVGDMLKRELRSGFRSAGPNEQYGMLESLAGRGLREALEKAGYDGIKYTEAHSDAYIAFKPEQIKSAIGNRGTYDDSPDIRFARKGGEAAAEPGDDKGNAEGTKLPLRLPATDVLNKARGLVMLVAPMSAGEQNGQAASQQFINNVRAARMGWDRVDGILRKEFTPAERKEMMLAGEDENRRILEGENSTAKGLSVLSKKQRDHMYALHDWSTELWDRAKQAGMVEGDGVPFWTPRMAVLMVDGLAEKLPEGGGRKMAGDIVGGNLSTTAPSMKERKHPYLRESEAALKAKFGEDAKYVDDVLAMPHAMQKFENAIIGREFVNRIKEIGLATGQDIVATGKAHDPNYFTLPHPALVNAKPKFVTDAETGKKVPAIDQNGDMLFESDPLYIKKEWEGPIKAVLSTKTNAVYTGYMLLKSKAMTAIMYSPLIHQQVIFGRALAYSDMASGGPFKTVALYFTGHAAKKDDAFMRKMVEAGLVPIGDRHNMLDVSDIANGDIKKSGGWMDPDESWISLTAQKAGNAVKAGAGDKIKSGLDAVGDAWHNTLLWRRIGDLQAGIAKDAYEKLTAKGFSDKVAATAAAHLANRYAGSIGSENMSKLARGAGNVALFSLSFNAANVGTVKDAAFGTTAGLNALIKENAKSPMEAAQIQQFLKNKARWGLVKDYAYFVIGMNLANLWFQRDKDAEWDFKGSVDRGLEQELKIAQRTWMHMTLHPTDVETYLSAMTGSQDNEPGKENRVHMGNQETGRAMYMRLPTGKVVEDLVGWFSDPAKLASAKQSPFLRAVIKGFENERDQYGSPIRDPKDPFYKRVADTAKFVLSTHFPSDQVQTLMDLKNGVGTPLDKEKIKGNLTGLTVSQGHPLGPEAGVAAKVEEANKMSTLHTMPEVRHLLRYGREDEARALLEEKTTLTPKEINKIIRKVDEPKGQMSSTQRRNFNRHAVDADQDRMDNVTR